MIFKMYSIKDKLSGFGFPIPFTNEEMAKRYFKTQLIQNPIMQNSKGDFALYKIGEFDSETPDKSIFNDIELIMEGE